MTIRAMLASLGLTLVLVGCESPETHTNNPDLGHASNTAGEATTSPAHTAAPTTASPESQKTMSDSIEKIVKSPEEWQKLLTPEEYRVARQKGTERAWTGRYVKNHEDGVYTCVACGLPLFDSATKFESGSGWPSYYQPIKAANVTEIRDTSHGMVRTEVVCARCDSHLGHVFDDGPKPTGLRYCINSVSLNFVSRTKAAE